MCCNKPQVILMISFYAIIPQNPCKQFLPFLVSPRLSCTEVLPLCTSLSCRKELLNCLELRPPKTNTTKKVSVVFYAPRTEKRLKRDKKLEKKKRTRQKKLKVTSKLAHINVAIQRSAQIRFWHVQSRQETISKAMKPIDVLPRALSFFISKTDKLWEASKIKSGFEWQYLSSWSRKKPTSFAIQGGAKFFYNVERLILKKDSTRLFPTPAWNGLENVQQVSENQWKSEKRGLYIINIRLSAKVTGE